MGDCCCRRGSRRTRNTVRSRTRFRGRMRESASHGSKDRIAALEPYQARRVGVASDTATSPPARDLKGRFMFHVPERYRITNGHPLATDFTAGNNGAFLLPAKIGSRRLAVIASDGKDWKLSGLDGIPWEHVSVHCFEGKRQYTPTWLEMCHIKEIFWDADDLVVQFHPRKSEYVNNHANTLHLWRPIGIEIPTPPASTVGYKELGTVGGET